VLAGVLEAAARVCDETHWTLVAIGRDRPNERPTERSVDRSIEHRRVLNVVPRVIQSP